MWVSHLAHWLIIGWCFLFSNISRHFLLYIHIRHCHRVFGSFSNIPKSSFFFSFGSYCSYALYIIINGQKNVLRVLKDQWRVSLIWFKPMKDVVQLFIMIFQLKLDSILADRRSTLQFFNFWWQLCLVLLHYVRKFMKLALKLLYVFSRLFVKIFEAFCIYLLALAFTGILLLNWRLLYSLFYFCIEVYFIMRSRINERLFVVDLFLILILIWCFTTFFRAARWWRKTRRRWRRLFDGLSLHTSLVVNSLYF